MPKKKKKNSKGGLFKPPKHKWLAKIITFKDPDSTEKAAEKLVNALERKRLGKKKIGRKRALTIAKSLQYAANRAKAATKRKNLSPEERRELKEIHEIYAEAAEEAWEIYRQVYSDD